ncbi:hypothetical protein MIND_00963100 [Mycena indigotica]|uniref:Uncharacterized protein n=1 Tax=Mycena indigotica TaxID=2126181 RepID=A0A8H6VX40_9AGAR|nr:uncharacterized protein MIND_00963100 [Mycena indigotica]KAF7297299.1 hypothetical protein MIND_00963100 [Mycena indigotica]
MGCDSVVTWVTRFSCSSTVKTRRPLRLTRHARIYSLRSRSAALYRDGNSDDPQFPASPASCGVCQQNYQSMKLCLQQVPVMVNFTTVIQNPGSFADVIICACRDPFHSTFGPCVDCFQQTNQERFLLTDNPNAVINGINKVCGLEGALFGAGVSSSIIPPDSTRTLAPNNGNPSNTASGSTASQSNSATSLRQVVSTSSWIFGALALLVAVEW